jgi:hypothetical protein
VSEEDNRQYCIRCKVETCKLAIHCYKNKKTVHITKLVLDHSCDQYANLHVSANSAFVRRKVSELISDNASMPVSQIQAFMRRKHGIDVPYWAAWR